MSGPRSVMTTEQLRREAYKCTAWAIWLAITAWINTLTGGGRVYTIICTGFGMFCLLLAALFLLAETCPPTDKETEA